MSRVQNLAAADQGSAVENDGAMHAVIVHQRPANLTDRYTDRDTTVALSEALSFKVQSMILGI